MALSDHLQNFKLFGFQITKQKEVFDDNTKVPASFTSSDVDDGSITIDGNGFYSQFVNFDGFFQTDYDLVQRYRTMSLHPEVDSAIEDIVTEAIVTDEQRAAVSLQLNGLKEIDKRERETMQEEFTTILSLLKFMKDGHSLFKQWYVDGRLVFYITIDENDKTNGITKITKLDPTKVRRIREVIKERDPDNANIEFIKEIQEYYIYNETSGAAYPNSGIKISKDSIVFINSGLWDASQKRVYGYLNPAIRPLNQLRMIEDAVVIYRISRAPERRIFYIDTGNLPKPKAEAYIRGIMNQYKNKLQYDATTGEVKDNRNFQSMLEDFWIPRREGGKGTEISRLEGGANLGELADVQYFQKKLYQSLKVPVTRLNSEEKYGLGRSDQISREEVKFSKFVAKLRNKFSEIFLQLLKTQLILKNVVTEQEWDRIENSIAFNFQGDTYFAELKDVEVMTARVDLLDKMKEYIGTYYSKEFVRKNILRQTPEDMDIIDTQIRGEQASDFGDPNNQDPNANAGGSDPSGGSSGSPDMGTEPGTDDGSPDGTDPNAPNDGEPTDDTLPDDETGEDDIETGDDELGDEDGIQRLARDDSEDGEEPATSDEEIPDEEQLTDDEPEELEPEPDEDSEEIPDEEEPSDDEVADDDNANDEVGDDEEEPEDDESDDSDEDDLIKKFKNKKNAPKDEA